MEYFIQAYPPKYLRNVAVLIISTTTVLWRCEFANCSGTGVNTASLNFGLSVYVYFIVYEQMFAKHIKRNTKQKYVFKCFTIIYLFNCLQFGSNLMYTDIGVQRLNALLCDVMEMNLLCFRYRQRVSFRQTIGKNFYPKGLN